MQPVRALQSTGKSKACFTWHYAFVKNSFTNKEMSLFMSEVKQKKDPTKDDRMFGFGFDSSKAIYQTRGFREIRDMSQYLIENRLDEIRNSSY